MRCGAPFSGHRSPREPCQPEGAFRWSSSWGFALQDCLQGGWAGYSFGPPARQVFGPRPAAPVSRFLGSGWTVPGLGRGPEFTISVCSVVASILRERVLRRAPLGVLHTGPGSTTTGLRIRQPSGHLFPRLPVLRLASRPFPEGEISKMEKGRNRGGSERVKLRRQKPSGAKFRLVLGANSGGRTLHQIANRDNGSNEPSKISTTLGMRSWLTGGDAVTAN
jgi:hypothetical protein